MALLSRLAVNPRTLANALDKGFWESYQALALEHGLNCSTSHSSTQIPFSAAGPLQNNDVRNVGGNCRYTDDEDCDEPIIGSGLCGQGTDAHDCAGIQRPGAALGGGQFRTGTPCVVFLFSHG